MKFLLIFTFLLSSLLVLAQSTEIIVKSDLRIVIFEGDQYKGWYGQYHANDLLKPNKVDTPETPLKPYEIKWEKQKDKARKKEQKATIYHEAIIPVELVFKFNLDSLPVPVITKIKVNKYQDSLISVEFRDITFDNASPEFGNGFCSFRFYMDITNNHFSKNQEDLKVYTKQMGFAGHINFDEGEKGDGDAGFAGNIYSRGEYSIYKVDGKTYSYIPFYYRFQNDFEEALKVMKY